MVQKKKEEDKSRHASCVFSQLARKAQGSPPAANIEEVFEGLRGRFRINRKEGQQPQGGGNRKTKKERATKRE